MLDTGSGPNYCRSKQAASGLEPLEAAIALIKNQGEALKRQASINKAARRRITH